MKEVFLGLGVGSFLFFMGFLAGREGNRPPQKPVVKICTVWINGIGLEYQQNQTLPDTIDVEFEKDGIKNGAIYVWQTNRRSEK